MPLVVFETQYSCFEGLHGCRIRAFPAVLVFTFLVHNLVICVPQRDLPFVGLHLLFLGRVPNSEITVASTYS